MDKNKQESINLVVQQLIEIVESDLSASKVLYEQGLYPQSIFYLQQSIEKLVKALGVKLKVIEPEDLLTKISHKTFNIYFMAIELMMSQLADKSQDLSENTVYKGMLDFRRTIEKHNAGNELHDDEEIEELFELIDKTYTYAEKDPNSSGRGSEKIANIDFPKIFKALWNFKKLIYLIVVNIGMIRLTSRHVGSSRYPYPSEKKHPNDIYTEDHYLVKNYENICKYHEISIGYFKELNESFLG